MYDIQIPPSHLHIHSVTHNHHMKMLDLKNIQQYEKVHRFGPILMCENNCFFLLEPMDISLTKQMQ